MANHPIDQKLTGLEKKVNELIRAYQSEKAKTSQLESKNQSLKTEVAVGYDPAPSPTKQLFLQKSDSTTIPL